MGNAQTVEQKVNSMWFRVVLERKNSNAIRVTSNLELMIYNYLFNLVSYYHNSLKEWIILKKHLLSNYLRFYGYVDGLIIRIQRGI